jgi:hypothetical protein
VVVMVMVMMPTATVVVMVMPPMPRVGHRRAAEGAGEHRRENERA